MISVKRGSSFSIPHLTHKPKYRGQELIILGRQLIFVIFSRLRKGGTREARLNNSRRKAEHVRSTSTSYFMLKSRTSLATCRSQPGKTSFWGSEVEKKIRLDKFHDNLKSGRNLEKCKRPLLGAGKSTKSSAQISEKKTLVVDLEAQRFSQLLKRDKAANGIRSLIRNSPEFEVEVT